MRASGGGFARARADVGLSQDDVARFIGVNRAMVSYWESGTRKPNVWQLTALARLYRIPIDELRHDTAPDGSDYAAMLYRSEDGLAPAALRGLRDFTAFLGFYGDLAEQVGFEVRGLRHSPFIESHEFQTQGDARRKAEEVRSWLRFGLGPIPDIDQAAEMLGVTVFRADLGDNVGAGISGGFLNHDQVGFAIVVNTNMTPGRRRFTIAHELAHAMFHSRSRGVSVSTDRKDGRERFADLFASEFLMPTEALRRLTEEWGMVGKLTDPADVVRIQRSFNVSWAMTLLRLRQVKLLTPQTYSEFRRVRPVLLARALGYEPSDEEYGHDLRAWRIARFPRRFWRLVHVAIADGAVSVPTIASQTQLSIPEVTSIVATPDITGDADEDTERELAEFENSRVFSG